MDASTLIAMVLCITVAGAAGFWAGRQGTRRDAGEQRLRAVLDTASMGVLINTRDGHVLYSNPKMLEVFGASAADFAGTPMAERYVDPADRDRYLDRVYRLGAGSAEEIRFRRDDGTVFLGRLTTALLDYGGRRCHVTWFVDITEERSADSDRRMLAERLEMALEATRSATWDADLVNRTCWWSDTFPRMLGFDHVPEMPPDFWDRRLHPDDRERVFATIDAHLRGETESYAYAYRLRREDGGWIWLEARGRCLRDAAGRAVRYLGIMADITERTRQEERLRESEAQLIHILETSPMAVNITTREGAWLFCNAQSCAIMGLSRAELTAMPTPDFYADPAERGHLLDRFAREGSFRNAEMRLRRPDGSVVWALSSWDRIVFDGQEAMLTWLYDITDRKAAEAELSTAKEAAEQALAELRDAQQSLIQAETMASLGALVAGVAHEVNTPVGIGLTAATHIGEMTRLMHGRFEQGTLRRSEMADYLDTVAESARLMVGNIERAAELIQSFKQVAVDQTSGDRRRFDLATYIEEVVFSLRPRLRRSAATVTVDCPVNVEMDSFPGALSQILTNLLINAVVHGFADGARPGNVAITVGTVGEGRVLLSVADDGEGIPPEHLSRVFEPFFTTRRGQGGSGLGLHIVFNTVTQLLGGTIRVDSQPGEGTRFLITVPRVAPAGAPARLSVAAG